MKPLAIIGLDPGTTSAYAIIDMQGNILSTHAAKEMPLSALIAQIIGQCYPLVVSTDKAKVPGMVEEFSRKVGAEIVAPAEDLTKEEKRKLLNAPYHSSHEQDSLAAAFYAHKQYKPFLEKIERFIQRNRLEEQRVEFTRRALTKDVHFTALKEILTSKKPEGKIMAEVISERRITKKDFLSLYSKLSLFKEQNRTLERKLAALKEQVKALEQQKKGLREQMETDRSTHDPLRQVISQKDRVISRQREQLSRLSGTTDRLYGLFSNAGEYRVARKLKTLRWPEFMAKNNAAGISRNDLLLIENPHLYSRRTLQQAAGQGVVILSAQKPPPEVRSFFQWIQQPACTAENEHFALIRRKDIEKEINSKDFIALISEYRKERGWQNKKHLA